MENDRKKPESDDEPQDGPTFDEVVRKMLNTPPKPKKAAGDQSKAVLGDKGPSRKERTEATKPSR